MNPLSFHNNIIKVCILPAPPDVDEELATEPPDAAAAAAAQPLEPQEVEVEVEDWPVEWSD